ncbi:NAD-dependent epimerase/dehydratase family protein [Amycolatopsis sp. NPDC058278]|uniref:NAD-dependent epimerase/dehydratase family protein n=1 Tax=Amycolatopsis sp. NPDC058278 TaxID=3346417 RepID=UPI0036D9D2CD
MTAHRRGEVPSFLAGRVTVEQLDVTDRDAFLALGERHAISDIVHLAGSIPGENPVDFFRTDTAGLLNALDAARTWGVRRFGTIWGPLVDPDSPIPRLVNAASPPPGLHAGDGGDVCYAPDAGRAIALLTTASKLNHDTYNVSSGRPFTYGEFAEALKADLPPGRANGPGEDPYLDISRLTGDTGFKPQFDVAASVADYLKWRTDNAR